MIKWSEIEPVRAIISTFMPVFQNNLAQFFSLKSRMLRNEMHHRGFVKFIGHQLIVGKYGCIVILRPR